MNWKIGHFITGSVRTNVLGFSFSFILHSCARFVCDDVAGFISEVSILEVFVGTLPRFFFSMDWMMMLASLFLRLDLLGCLISFLRFATGSVHAHS